MVVMEVDNTICSYVLCLFWVILRFVCITGTLSITSYYLYAISAP